MKLFFYIGVSIIIVSCTNTNTVSLKNGQKEKLVASYQLILSSEKKILLDDETAPNSPYMQIIEDEHGKQILTLLNPYKNAIYFYDYTSGTFIKKIEYEKEGTNAVLSLGGYLIKNMDSIYVYNSPLIELALTDSTGCVKQRISLRNNRDDKEWSLYYPQYLFTSVNPFIEVDEKLILTGMSPFYIVDSLIDKFHFTSYIELKSNDVKFMHSYPKELYGSDAIWPDPIFTQPYPALTPEGEMIYSFPISHDLYINRLNTEDYKTVYAGANVAGTISSIDHIERPSREMIHTHILQQDLYAGIRHDPYRNVYYRFLSQGIPEATFSTPLSSKPIFVIIMDEQFNYLGETLIGTGLEWNLNNSFVTSEGLMIEYIDKNINSEEEFLTLKIFEIEKI